LPSTYSPSLRLELIGAGDQSGTWGTTTNTNLGTLLEQSIVGVQTIAMANANYTLSNFNGVSDEARKAVLVVSGANATIRDIIAPLVAKTYIIRNNTSGGFAINIRAASGASVSIPNGVTSLVYCDGANFSLALTQTAVSQGTGITVSTVGTTSTVSFGPLSSATLAAALTDETGTGLAVFATSPTLVTPALGTPTVLVGTNITGTAAALTVGNATNATNATNAINATTSTTQTSGTNTTAIATTAYAYSNDIGWGQTWQNVTASRASATSYTNSTGKPIMVSIYSGSFGTGALYVDGIAVSFNVGTGYYANQYTAIVPNGSAYAAYPLVAGFYWSELR
jgi:hypothetical protein